jgi:hypothetical protein
MRRLHVCACILLPSFCFRRGPLYLITTTTTENNHHQTTPPVVEHFLTDYERNGAYTGFPCLGVDWQRMENPYLRAALGMKPGMKGVLVRRVDPTAPASAQVKQFDILLSFDGVPIANDGTVPFRSGERIGFSYLGARSALAARLARSKMTDRIKTSPHPPSTNHQPSPALSSPPSPQPPPPPQKKQQQKQCRASTSASAPRSRCCKTAPSAS